MCKELKVHFHNETIHVVNVSLIEDHQMLKHQVQDASTYVCKVLFQWKSHIWSILQHIWVLWLIFQHLMTVIETHLRFTLTTWMCIYLIFVFIFLVQRRCGFDIFSIPLFVDRRHTGRCWFFAPRGKVCLFPKSTSGWVLRWHWWLPQPPWRKEKWQSKCCHTPQGYVLTKFCPVFDKYACFFCCHRPSFPVTWKSTVKMILHQRQQK